MMVPVSISPTVPIIPVLRATTHPKVQPPKVNKDQTYVHVHMPDGSDRYRVIRKKTNFNNAFRLPFVMPLALRYGHNYHINYKWMSGYTPIKQPLDETITMFPNPKVTVNFPDGSVKSYPIKGAWPATGTIYHVDTDDMKDIKTKLSPYLNELYTLTPSIDDFAKAVNATDKDMTVTFTATQKPIKVNVHYPNGSVGTYKLTGRKFSSSQLNNIKSNVQNMNLADTKYIETADDLNDSNNSLSSTTFSKLTNDVTIKATLKANPIGYINDNGQWVDEQTDTHMTLKQFDPDSQISVGGPDKLSTTDPNLCPIFVKTNKEDEYDDSTIDVDLANQFGNTAISEMNAQLKPNQQVYIDKNLMACDPQTHKEIGM